MSLVYIAGYLTRNDAELSEDQMLERTTFYYQKYGKFTNALDRGGLNIPSDYCCQWTFSPLYCSIQLRQRSVENQYAIFLWQYQNSIRLTC